MLGYQLTIDRISYKLSLLAWKALHTAEPFILPFWVNLSLCSSSNPTFLQLLVFLQYQLVSQVTSPHVLFLFLHHRPGTPYVYITLPVHIFALQRISLPLSVNWSHISSSLLSLSSQPVLAPLIRYTILALYKFICRPVCMYVCMS